MSDTSPPQDHDERCEPGDECAERVAAIDDYLAGVGDRQAFADLENVNLDPALFGGLLDAMLMLRQSAANAA